MKPIYLSLGILLWGLSSPVYGQQQVIKKNWMDQAIETKINLQSRLSGTSVPVVSDWIKYKNPASALSADLQGKKLLVLLTRGGADGTKNDHAVWAGARLQKADGTYVWLDELEYSTPSKQKVEKNKNIKGGALAIAKEKFNHALLNLANGLLVYQLDGNYIRFESKVGIDDAGTGGSAYFGVLDFDPTTNFGST